jgi:hypothetical protein
VALEVGAWEEDAAVSEVVSVEDADSEVVVVVLEAVGEGVADLDMGDVDIITATRSQRKMGRQNVNWCMLARTSKTESLLKTTRRPKNTLVSGHLGMVCHWGTVLDGAWVTHTLGLD